MDPNRCVSSLVIYGVLLSLFLFTPSELLAEEGSTSRLSLTFSPIHLALPVVEIQGEYGLTSSLSVAGVGGYGNANVPSNLSGDEISFNVFEIGGQFRLYPIGDFEHGIQLGAEALYTEVTTEEETTYAGERVVGTGEGLALGPFIGYKYVAGFGITIDIQGGVQRLFAQAEASQNGRTASGEREEWIPLANLNIGLSF